MCGWGGDAPHRHGCSDCCSLAATQPCPRSGVAPSLELAVWCCSPILPVLHPTRHAAPTTAAPPPPAARPPGRPQMLRAQREAEERAQPDPGSAPALSSSAAPGGGGRKLPSAARHGMGPGRAAPPTPAREPDVEPASSGYVPLRRGPAAAPLAGAEAARGVGRDGWAGGFGEKVAWAGPTAAAPHLRVALSWLAMWVKGGMAPGLGGGAWGRCTVKQLQQPCSSTAVARREGK